MVLQKYYWGNEVGGGEPSEGKWGKSFKIVKFYFKTYVSKFYCEQEILHFFLVPACVLDIFINII